ncbi:Gfo/Idh/MocA family oxidoreductase [Nocardioides sp. Kera G14]|uniref:Gfo/Idh/MocA family oxidoreductase n=1 Tax=Nocardioides sp. Kera G14 TaxID=2884264 RepID=UPI0039EF1A44
MLRAAVVGVGQMGRHHARVLSSMEGVELVAVVDPRPQSDPHVESLRVHDLAALERLTLDMAIVAVPTAVHASVAELLFERGTHVLIEKPVAPTAAQARMIADAAARTGVIACVGHIERFNPALQSLRQRLARGDLGEIYQIATRRQGPFPERIADVGVILDLATHDIDTTAWVAGKPYTAVSAQTANRSGREHEDLVAAVGTLADGTVVNHLVNWLSPLKERVTVVTGERGTFVADTLTADLTIYENGAQPVEWEALKSFRGVVQGDMTRFAIAKQEPLRNELMAFRDAVRGESMDVVGVEDAALTVAVAEEMLQSSRGQATGRA